MSEDVAVNSENIQAAPVDNTVKHEPEVKQQEQNDDYHQRNWNELRRQKNDLEKQLRMQQEAIDRLTAAQNAPKEEPDEIDQIGDEEFIPKGKVNKLVRKEAQKIAKEIAEQENKRYRAEQEKSQSFDRLQRQYPDFSQVVNNETLLLLEEQDPELAKSIADTNDPYKIAIQSYKYIKAMGIESKVPNARRAKEIDKKIEKNEKTVQTPQAYEKRPMAEAFKLTDSMKSDLYSEMMSYANQAGMGY